MAIFSPLPRISPSEAGLSSKELLRLIDDLENGWEMHGILLAKGGKICMEGFWQPYSAEMIHCLWSQTKSYTASAIGCLCDEGKLDLDEKVCEILPQYMPDEMNDDLRAMTVRDLLTMHSGQHGPQSRTDPEWEKLFFSGEFSGTGKVFGYSGICSSLLGVILKEKTGEDLLEYLRPRVFEKIGIDAGSLKCLRHPDGIEYGGGGMMTHCEDNLRLGLLYLQNGVFGGERVLSEEWIRAATSKQTETTGDYENDGGCGYGYQIWRCKPQGVYRFDGAFGQYVIVDPKRDLVLSILQAGGGQPQLDRIWEWLEKCEGATPDADEALRRRLSRLALPAPECGRVSGRQAELYGKTFRFPENGWYLFSTSVAAFSYKVPKGIESIRFAPERGALRLSLLYGGKEQELTVSLDGALRMSDFNYAPDLPQFVYANGKWTAPDTLDFTLRFIEGAFTTRHILTLLPDGRLRLAHPPAPAPRGAFAAEESEIVSL